MTGRVREAVETDIPAVMELRLAVRENRLFDPGQVTAEDCLAYVRDEDGAILGFSASTCETGWIWALFVRPEHEARGIGRALFAVACDALTGAGHGTLRLSTDSGTRAERFYRAAGWRAAGRTPDGELIFESGAPPR